MRIVQALGSPQRGGVERFFVRLVKALHARGLSQSLLMRRNAWAAVELGAAGIPIQPAWFGGKLDFITRAKYRAVLDSKGASVAINWMPNAAAACPGGPWVRVARLGKCYPLDAYKSCDHLIAASPRIATHLESLGWPQGRISTIPNFVPRIEAAPARRAAFNTPEDVPLILWLGRMAYNKGPDLAVRALAAVPGAYLWMAGTGPLEAEVKELGAQMGVLGRIRFLGWRDDIHALLKAADIFIRPSRGEGIGNILEAWANGLPVISACSEDTCRLVNDGQSGLLIAKEDPAALSLALKNLITNRDFARSLAERGKAQFKAAYSEEPVTAMYLELCRRLQDEYASQRTSPNQERRGAAAPEFAR